MTILEKAIGFENNALVHFYFGAANSLLCSAEI